MKRKLLWMRAVWMGAVLWVAGATQAQEAAQDPVRVRLVAAEMPDRLISDLEVVVSVDDPSVDTSQRRDRPSLGDDATLWVRGASVDGTNTFERYYKGTYINRISELTFAPETLAVGDHIIEPGHHVFRYGEDGTLSSTDPDIVIAGRTVSLKTYRIEIFNVDADKSGPPESRLLGRTLNVDLMAPGGADATNVLNEARASNMLSHFRNFCPLRVYLPANTNQQSYVLRPGMQPFRVLPGGTVQLEKSDVQGISAEGSQILVAYMTFSAWVKTGTALSASFGGASIPRTDEYPARIRVGPTRGDPIFSAALEGLPPSFGLKLSGDVDRYPNKYMVADNTRNLMHVRLMAVESGVSIFERGTPAVARLQFKENVGAVSTDAVQNAAPLIQALKEAIANTPVSTDDPVAVQARRICAFILNVSESDRIRITAWLDEPAATMAQMKEGALPFFARLNACLYERVLFDEAAIDALKPDDALRAEAGRMATLDDTQLMQVNRRLLGLVFPGVFAPPQTEPPARPKLRLAYSPYDPLHETSRSWNFFDAQSWDGDTLTFQTPDVPYGFYRFRVILFGPEDKDTISPLTAEFVACVIEPKQDGTACFISNKGRDAFVPGETIRLQAVLRSRAARPAGTRTVVLKHPDGREDRLSLEDPGGTWHSRALAIPDTITRRLIPGRYELMMTDLPPDVACSPFRFDMAPPRESRFRMIKASKYTHETYALLGSQKGQFPIDLERAIASLAELGYNRFDYHTYSDDHHARQGEMRSVIAETDARLMPPDALYFPSGRDQILNACVRYGLEFGDVLHGAGDNEIPRYIDGYINAGERWIRREVTSMRHSPAFDGVYLYEEAYERGLVGVPKKHDNFFPAWRLKRVAQAFTNVSPNKIRADVSRNVTLLKTSPAQWDPRALERFLDLRTWEMHGWGDFNSRLAAAGRDLLPRARIGTYHCSFMFVQNGYGAVCSAADFDNGYHPDVFENLDIASTQHYHDGPTIGYWTHSPIMIQLLRASPASHKRLVWANISMNPDARTLSDGQLQRQMAFAMLAQGADGISTFHMHETFADTPNPNMIKSKETMRLLNTQILAPFGEVFSSATKPGYLKVGIVNTLAQLSMSEFKNMRTANQLEELWVSCWRLGYPAVFLREGDLEQPLEGYQAIFVPGIRFPGELTAGARESLRAAIKRGCKVIVERDSTLDAEIAEVTKMADFDLMNFFYGPGYNVAGYDAELDMVFNKSQAATDYLRVKMVEWGIEPAAQGPFKVGPNWRDGGDIQYLIMSNYEDPDYGQTSHDIMSKPVFMPLTVPAHRGEVAYDLLARTGLPLGKTNDLQRSLVLDMTRVQGALAAFLPEKISALRLTTRRDTAGASVLLKGELMGESGKALSGVFPTRIRLLDGQGKQLFSMYRALNSKTEIELALPLTSSRDGGLVVEVVENISGKSCRLAFESTAGVEPVLRLEDTAAPYVPYPSEVERFLKSSTNAVLVLGRGMEGPKAKADVDRLIAGLGAKGITITPMPENRAWRVISGDPSIAGDPYADGFHYWHGGMGGSDPGPIEPRAVVDSPLIILSASGGSQLLNMLVNKGFVTELPIGAAGLPVQPTLQVASRGFHWNYDTLCLVANDGDGVSRVVSRVLEDPALTGATRAAEAPPKRPSYEKPDQREGGDTVEQKPATSFMGNNEYVIDMKFDVAGNIYVITWGHGDNLYSLDPQGKLRFSMRLPEMGACRLDIDTDRVVVFTGYGSRIYQVALDGKPISQARLSLDPGVNHKGPTYRERHTADLLRHGLGLNEDLFRYAYVPGKRMIVYYEPLFESMRMLDENYTLIAEWKGDARTDEDGDVTYRRQGEFVCSPDGTRLAQMEDGMLVLRDLTDPTVRKLAERYGAGSSLAWHPGESGPTVGRTHFNGDLEWIRQDAPAPGGAVFDLGLVGGLVPDGKDLRLVRVTDAGETETARLGPFPWMPTFARVSPDGTHVVLLDEYWNAFVHDVKTGKRTGQITLSEMGFSITFTSDSKTFLVGGLRGTVMCCDTNAALLWSTSLMPYNQSLKQTAFPNVDPSIPDGTDTLYKPVVDEPGELDSLVTLDRTRLVNGDFEGDGGWQVDTNAGATAATPAYVDGGYESKRCLKVGETAVQQQIEGLIGEHFTWVLEFFYRRATPDQEVSLLAGLSVDNRHPDNVVRVLECGKEWTFARITMKSGGDPTALRVGFQGQGGDAWVDSVTLRRIRFPSVNHMLYPPVYDVDPIVLRNPLFYRHYNPFGILREQIPNIVLAQRPEQIADALLADPFLQNGRLNEISSDWYHSYLGGSDTLISLGIKEPRWVSMVALYFNAYDEANTTRHFDIFVSDVAQRKVARVASVRNNRSLFRLIKFPARRADEVRIVLVNTLPRQRTVTEVEVYGPLSGSEKQGFVDADGQNTYMGSFARVETRQMNLAPEYESRRAGGAIPDPPRQGFDAPPRWATPVSQVMMSERNVYLSRAIGFNQRVSLDAPSLDMPAASFRTGGMGFGPVMTLYGGALLKPGTDGKLYCIDPSSGRQFWTKALGDRLTGSPAVIGLDVFIATDAGMIYTLDIASGALLGETKLSGPVYGSVATDGKSLFMISAAGFLHSIRVSGPEAWRLPVAPDTDATPAVDGGVVYMADQKGTARAVQADDGKVLWTSELGSEFCRCPVVLPEMVVFGCSDGRLTALNRRTGESVWQTQLQTRFLRYEPVPLLFKSPEPPHPLPDRDVQVDGVLDEWGPVTAELKGPDDITPAESRQKWTDTRDLGVKLHLGWGNNRLYVAAEVTDNAHSNTRAGDMIWNGDAMQMGLVTADGTLWNIALALTTNGVVFHQFAGKGDALIKAVTHAVVRDEASAVTRYELSLPLDVLGVKPDSVFGLNFIFFDDDDGKGQRYGLQMAPGLTQPPNPGLYPRYAMVTRPAGQELAKVVPAGTSPVLLCMSEGRPVLIDPANGQPTGAQLVTGSVQRDGQFKPDGDPPGIGELTAPISYYKGYLAFVPIEGDIGTIPMYNDSRYHNMGIGSAFLLKPVADAPVKPDTGPRTVAFRDKTVRIDGVVEMNEWGKSMLSLNGPEDIFPNDRRAKGEADGSTSWTSFDDLGAKVYMGWDSNRLYVAAAVADDSRCNPNAGETLFNGDAMQVGIVNPKGVHWNMGLALTDGGVAFYDAENPSNVLERVADYAVTASDATRTTYYELSLPLEVLGLKPGDEFGLNFAFLDDDKGNGVRYWLQLAAGLAGRDEKTPSPAKLYPRFVLGQ